MTENRARPQYGEYASADEQIAAGGHAVDVSPAASAGAPAASPPAASLAPPVAPPVASDRVPGTPPAGRRWDLPVTVALLVLGAYSVLSSIPAFLDLAAALNEAYGSSGYGEYTSTSLANGIGIAAIVVQSLVYVVTAALAVARLRARRLAFYIPLIGGVVSGVVVFVLLVVAITSDPALAAWVNSQS